MEKINIYKKVLILVSGIGTTLLTGFAGPSNSLNKKVEAGNSNQNCEHLIVNFSNQSVIFKECENYDIITDENSDGNGYSYTIKENGATVLHGYTLDYNDYYVNHVNGTDTEINEIERKAITEGANIYTLEK